MHVITLLLGGNTSTRNRWDWSKENWHHPGLRWRLRWDTQTNEFILFHGGGLHDFSFFSGYLSCLMDLADQATWAMGEVGWTLETNESQAADIDNTHGDHNGYITTHQSDHSIYIQKPSEGLTFFNIKQSSKLWLYYMFLTHWEVASTHPGWLSIEVSWHQPCTSCVWCFNLDISLNIQIWNR